MNDEIKFLKKLSKRDVMMMIVQRDSTIEMMFKYEDEDDFKINNFIKGMYTYMKKYKKSELINNYSNKDKLKEIVSEVSRKLYKDE